LTVSQISSGLRSVISTFCEVTEVSLPTRRSTQGPTRSK